MRLQNCEKVTVCCTAQCKMLLFCVKTIMRVMHFELAEETEEEERKKNIWPSGNFRVQYFHGAFSLY